MPCAHLDFERAIFCGFMKGGVFITVLRLYDSIIEFSNQNQQNQN